jgi:hypothetical protein
MEMVRKIISSDENKQQYYFVVCIFLILMKLFVTYTHGLFFPSLMDILTILGFLLNGLFVICVCWLLKQWRIARYFISVIAGIALMYASSYVYMLTPNTKFGGANGVAYTHGSAQAAAALIGFLLMFVTIGVGFLLLHRNSSRTKL